MLLFPTYVKVCFLCMVRCGMKQWKFPETPDICDYKRKDIVEIISPPSNVNVRKIMDCKEIEKYCYPPKANMRTLMLSPVTSDFDFVLFIENSCPLR